MAVSVAIASVVGTKLAVRFGTKQVVTVGLFCLAGFFAWVSTATTGTSYLEIAGQMVLGGSGVGLVSAPATEAIMGVVPTAKAGVGSAVNDATRLLGSTLGVAIIGSVYASIYASRLTAALPSAVPAHLARTAHDSAGAALAVADRLASTGHSSLAANLHHVATSAFFHGFATANVLAAGVAGAGALMALALLPAQPPAPAEDTAEASALASPAPAAARS